MAVRVQVSPSAPNQKRLFKGAFFLPEYRGPVVQQAY